MKLDGFASHKVQLRFVTKRAPPAASLRAYLSLKFIRLRLITLMLSTNLDKPYILAESELHRTYAFQKYQQFGFEDPFS